jgi:transposase InsO family protein
VQGKSRAQEGEGFFQAGGSALCKRAAAAERFCLIKALSGRFSTAWLSRQLGVARSGFYAWRQRQQNPGPRARENAALTAQVQTVFDRHRGFYGAPRVRQEIRPAGPKVGRHRVARLMRCSALKAKTRRGFRPCRNQGNWAGDITYIRTTAGWRYLAVWIDPYSRRVVGWALGHRKISCSMSAKGCCWENAVVESFFSTLKHELGLDDEAEILNSPQHLIRQLAFWIDGYYNHERRHSTIGYHSSIDYEQQFINTRTLTPVMP